MSAPICSAKSKNSWVPKALLSTPLTSCSCAPVRQPSFSKTGATLTYKAPEDRWYVQGFVQNIENEITLVDVKIADAAARESDLLAFQLGIEIGNRGAVMCPANRTGGTSPCSIFGEAPSRERQTTRLRLST